MNAYMFYMAHADNFFAGYQSISHFGNAHSVWAVHDGDVAALIPEPQTYAMMLAGLLAIFGFVRLRQQS